MIDLAQNYEKKPLSVSAIAAREDISPKFLSQIIIPLKGAGLIQSTRGALGGYELTKPPGKITIYDVFRVLEGDCLLTECVEDSGACTRSGYCVAQGIWIGLSKIVEERLRAVTFKDLVLQSKSISEKISPVYQI